MSTSATCGERSKASRRVLTTSWPCPASATGSPTPGRSNPQLAKRLAHEPPLADARMRYHEVSQADPLVAEQQNVDVDDARTPAPGVRPAALDFDLLGRLQQLTRRARPIHLDHLVQELGLVEDAPRRSLDDAALTHDSRPLLTQAPACRAEVADSRSEIRAEAQVRDGPRMS